MATCERCQRDPHARFRKNQPDGPVELHWTCDGCFSGLEPRQVEPFDFRALTYQLLLPVIFAVTLAVVAGLMLT